MNNTIRTLLQENNPAKLGIISSIIIISGSVATNIKTPWISFINDFSLEFLIIGVALLFFFTGIKVNMYDEIKIINNQPQVFNVLPRNYTALSKACFFLFTTFMIVFILLLIFK